MATDDILASLDRLGLLAPGERPRLTPLSGGVSCDVFRADLARGTVCVKRALARLRVAADWTAPVERSAFEVAWLRTAGEIPGVRVPRVIAHDPESHLFVMSYLPPERYRLWKDELLEGRIDPGAAAEVGAALGRVHRTTAASPALKARFDTSELFSALRLEPYLLAAAEVHPVLRKVLHELAAETLATRTALVHGDVSPKNILLGDEGPVLLDAECAWYGDPAFDLAFVCTHLLLKAVRRPRDAERLAHALERLEGAYQTTARHSERSRFDARAAALLGALLLARVDGKSPVDYLTGPGDGAFVRATAARLLLEPKRDVSEVARTWIKELERR